MFNASALQLLAGKVAAVSGDIRKAIDITNHLIDLTYDNGECLLFVLVLSLFSKQFFFVTYFVVSIVDSVGNPGKLVRQPRKK